jgi:hypothetical protein
MQHSLKFIKVTVYESIALSLKQWVEIFKDFSRFPNDDWFIFYILKKF